MVFEKLDAHSYLIRLVRGEEMIQAMTSFSQKENISNATFTAIGSIENPTFAYYKIADKKYLEKKLEGIYELTSAIGNVALSEGKPLLHIHATMANEQLQVLGGHVVTMPICATAEVFLTTFPTAFEKKFDEAIGLRLWNCKNSL